MRILSLRGLLSAIGVVAFGSLCCSQPADDEAELRELREMEAAKVTVLKYADELDKGTESSNDLAKIAKNLAKQHKLRLTHMLFGLKRRNGIGIGELVKAGHKDSIELLIRGYAYKPPTKVEVTKYAGELIKAAQISLVIAEMTPYWGPTKPIDKFNTPERWKSISAEMKTGAEKLLLAAKTKDEMAVEAAAKKLNTSCVECHRRIHDDR